MHVASFNHTGGAGKSFTWESQMPHVGKRDASRGKARRYMWRGTIQDETYASPSAQEASGGGFPSLFRLLLYLLGCGREVVLVDGGVRLDAVTAVGTNDEEEGT